MEFLSDRKLTLDVGQVTTVISERAKLLVKRLIENRNNDRPPFLPEEYSRLLGIKQILKTDLGNTRAVLLRSASSPIIKVNINHSTVRRNFSCAHEIGHILLEGLIVDTSSEVSFRTFNPQAERLAYAKTIERLCDIAAAELLMPEQIFQKYLVNFGSSTGSISLLANVFKVSIPSTAIRVAELSQEPCVAILWNKSRSNTDVLHFQWSAGPGKYPKNKGNYIPKQKYISSPSSLHTAFATNGVVKSFKVFEYGKNRVRLPIESKGFGYDENRYVISLAFTNITSKAE